jgi:putative tryptophan/tyrosine transport system substrate-binding protein
MDVRWADSSTDLMRTFAKELVDLQPDVILSNSTPATAAFKRETQTIPIVFTIVTDPVGAGFVASLPHLGGNITGLSPFQESLTSKWLELLREIASGLKRAAMMFNPDTAPFTRSFFQPSFEATAQSFGMTPVVAPVHSDVEIETVITALGREPGGGLLTVPDAFIDGHRAPIISLAARNNIPAVKQPPSNAWDGGLLSYGADFREIFHRAAHHVDNVLRGAKPSELPVQLPTKYVMVINLKTAKALGLKVPLSILLRADEAIE